MKTWRVITWLVIAVMLVLLPRLAGYDPMRMASMPYSPPSLNHPAGTDSFGRDVFSRVLAGLQQTVLVSMIAVSTAVVIGGTLTVVAQMHRVLVTLVGGLVTAGLSIPPLILILAVITWLGQSPLAAAVAVGIAYSFGVARVLIDAAALERQQLHVEAAGSLGASRWRIITWHILPGLIRLLLSYGILVFAWAVTQLAGLSFLGVTGVPGAPELGLMMAESRYTIRDAPWAGVAPALALITLIVTVNWLSDRVTRR